MSGAFIQRVLETGRRYKRKRVAEHYPDFFAFSLVVAAAAPKLRTFADAMALLQTLRSRDLRLADLARAGIAPFGPAFDAAVLEQLREPQQRGVDPARPGADWTVVTGARGGRARAMARALRPDARPWPPEPTPDPATETPAALQRKHVGHVELTARVAPGDLLHEGALQRFRRPRDEAVGRALFTFVDEAPAPSPLSEPPVPFSTGTVPRSYLYGMGRALSGSDAVGALARPASHELPFLVWGWIQQVRAWCASRRVPEWRVRRVVYGDEVRGLSPDFPRSNFILLSGPLTEDQRDALAYVERRFGEIPRSPERPVEWDGGRDARGEPWPHIVFGRPSQLEVWSETRGIPLTSCRLVHGPDVVAGLPPDFPRSHLVLLERAHLTSAQALALADVEARFGPLAPPAVLPPPSTPNERFLPYD